MDSLKILTKPEGDTLTPSLASSLTPSLALSLDLTVVTAFFDLDRWNWVYYKRSEDEYLKYFKNMLQLDCNMVIFTEPKYESFVRENREGNLKDKTIVMLTFLQDIVAYKKYYSLIKDIMNKPGFTALHPNPTCPELTKPLYDVMVWNKMFFLSECVHYNFFNTNYFFWMDAGYTHNTIDLKNIKWNPSPLLNKETFYINLLCDINPITSNPIDFFYQYKDVITGGFFGGHKISINQVGYLFYKLIDEIIAHYEIVDDEQYFLTILAKRYPELFTTIEGYGWYGGIKAFMS